MVRSNGLVNLRGKHSSVNLRVEEISKPKGRTGQQIKDAKDIDIKYKRKE